MSAIRPGARAAAPHRDQAPRVYRFVDISCPSVAEEAIVAILGEARTLGSEEVQPGLLRAYFEVAPRGLAARLRRAGATRVRMGRLVAADWVGQSRRRVQAVRIGPHVVRPPWSRTRPGAGGCVVVIDPARAFGTGSHESTRLVLQALSEVPPAALRVLDVGTGSGVLGLVAVRLGARRVVAIDIDPDAVAATGENAHRNGLAAAVLCVQGGPAAIGGTFGLVLANLTGPLLSQLAGEIVARVGARGTLVVAGLLVSEAASVVAAYATFGLVPVGERAEAGWCMLRMRRRRVRSR